LISDPQKVLERINASIPCQPLTGTNCPLWTNEKRINKYGSGAQLDISNIEKLKLSNKISEKANLKLKEEMPDILQDLFWSKHGDTMEMLGYARGEKY
jgi:hypothetical protein